MSLPAKPWLFRIVLNRKDERTIEICSHHSTRQAYELIRARFPKAGIHVLQRGHAGEPS